MNLIPSEPANSSMYPSVCPGPSPAFLITGPETELSGEGEKHKPSMQMRPFGCGLGLFCTSTYWFVPLKLSACPTLPAAKLSTPWNVPLFPPILSLAFPSPVHHPTRVGPPGAQTTGLTVSTALELVIEPSELVTLTE